MKKLVIVGASGFGREVQWLIERINKAHATWDFLGYIDDGMEKGRAIGDHVVLGGKEYLLGATEPIAVVCAIGNARVRQRVAEALKKNNNLHFPNIIDPDVVMSDRVEMGEGNIICASSTITIDIELADFVIVNLDCTIGHDAVLNSYVTLYPSVNVSGNVHIGQQAEIGTGAQIIQGKTIGAFSVVGAGSVVVKNIPEKCTAVGCPAAPINFFEE